MVYISSDHRGFEVKNKIRQFFSENGILHQDLGPFEYKEDDDYPFYAFELARMVVTNQGMGILVCRSGAGMTIAANKVAGGRAALVESLEEAQLVRNDDDTNILVLDTETFDPQKDFEIIRTWLNTPFSNEERHIRRLKEISDYENAHPSGYPG